MTLLQQAIQTLPQRAQVVYAVLDWGLGHATRSAVVIQALQAADHTVTIASNGTAMDYLQQSFPTCDTITLPGYDVIYSKTRWGLRWTLATQVPHILRVIREEHVEISRYIDAHEVDIIISDNRYGCRHDDVPSILLTHQLRIEVGGLFGYFANVVLSTWCSRFDEVWVPDDDTARLSGHLSVHSTIVPRYIGTLSVMQPTHTAERVDILLALSGPEPQRTLLEEQLTTALRHSPSSILLVRGTQRPRTLHYPSAWQVIDLADPTQMSQAFAAAKVIISRSGYSTIMDLHHLGKRAVLVPTPGQPEQEYLGAYLARRLPEQYVVVRQDRLQDRLADIIHLSRV